MLARWEEFALLAKVVATVDAKFRFGLVDPLSSVYRSVRPHPCCRYRFAGPQD